MLPLLTFVHGALGAIALVAGRRSVTRLAAATGMAAAALLLTVDHDAAWRSMAVAPSALTVAALAVAATWLLVLVLDRDQVSAACAGVSATCLIAFSTSAWLVPALLFWVCGSVATGIALLAWTRRFALVPLAGSDLLLISAVALQIARSDSWSVPTLASPNAIWLVIASVALRGIAVAPLTRGVRACLDPVFVGGAFVVLIRLGGRPEPWMGVVVLAVACAAAVDCIVSARVRSVSCIAWPPALMLGVSFAAPDVAPRAGVAALLAVASISLWEHQADRASVARAIPLAAVPLTAAWLVMSPAARAAIGQWSSSRQLGPALVAVLSIVAVLLASHAAAAAGRAGTPGPVRGGGAIGAWTLALGSIAAGMTASDRLGLGAVGIERSGETMGLYLIALVVGGAAGFVTAGRELPAAPIDRRHIDVHAIEPPRLLGRLSIGAASILAAASAAAAAWITVAGLRVGFL